MAPRTRLQAEPSRRVQYARSAKATGNRETAAAPVIPSAVVKKSAPPKQKGVQKECAICATVKQERSFRVPKNTTLCAHLKDTCARCVGKLIKAKITNRDLQDGTLTCPFPACGFSVDFLAVQKMISTGTFEAWDAALLRYQLVTSPNFITCLNTACGLHYSVENWATECKSRKKVECPYCDSPHCVKCNLPWHSGKACDKAKDEAIAEELRKLGAKPCPKCGVNIKKEGGCDHMTCSQCGGNFCWECLVQYSANMQHAQGCRHGHQNIAADPRNWEGGQVGIPLPLIRRDAPGAAMAQGDAVLEGAMQIRGQLGARMAQMIELLGQQLGPARRRARPADPTNNRG